MGDFEGGACLLSMDGVGNSARRWRLAFGTRPCQLMMYVGAISRNSKGMTRDTSLIIGCITTHG